MSARKIVEQEAGRLIDTTKAAADFDLRESNRARTHAMLREADPCGLRYLEETSLSRVWQHATDPNTSIGIITAFKQAQPGQEQAQAKINAEANQRLASDLRQAGFGYFFLRGNYVMQDGTPVQEISLFVIGRPGESDRLLETLQHLRAKYGQESILFKPEGTDQAQLVYADSVQPLGKLHPNRVSAYMSELYKGAGRGGTFVFEEVVHTSQRRGMFAALGSERRLAQRIGAPGIL